MKKKKNTKKEKHVQTEKKGINVCIVCKKELKGKELRESKLVKEDFIIENIRKVKRRLNVAMDNKLHVCKNDLKEQQKRRKSFEKDITITSIIGIFIFISLSLLPIITVGEINIGAILLGLGIGVLLIMLAGFLRYAPALKK